ncbi:hypothetical protein MOTE_09790 [Moorella thermoacetica]|uniref:HepT-like domain-containing protein n=1 Tax=Neomoorella thermoacetica TaxID=1525 RepID=A0A1J5P2I6_NEOTH|nr:hypothetical protein MOTE_09790 [Moorella thermoacetica]
MFHKKWFLAEASIHREMSNLEKLEKELTQHNLFPKIQTDSLGGFSLADETSQRLIGSILHDYYTGIEKIFRIVAKDIDCSIPEDELWDRELLDQMTLEVPGVRPALLSAATTRKLEALRDFRQDFRDLYDFKRTPDKIMALLKELPGLTADFKKDLENFIAKMRQIYGLKEPSNTVT